MKEQEPINFKQEKDKRHVENLRIFTGRWHGITYIDGRPQIPISPLEIYRRRRIGRLFNGL